MTKSEYRTKLRNFVRDKEALNRLLKGTESTDPDLDLALELALDDFNSAPPDLGITYTYTNFPSVSLLIMGGAIQLLESAGILQSRNQLNYNDGGLYVSVDDKTGLYQSWLKLFVMKYENMKERIKVQLNMDQAWGYISSEYAM